MDVGFSFLFHPSVAQQEDLGRYTVKDFRDQLKNYEGEVRVKLPVLFKLLKYTL